MIKKLFGILLVFLFGVLMSSNAFALFFLDFVKVNDDEVFESATNFVLDVDRGDELDVKVRFFSDTDVEDVQIEAALRGIDSDDSVDDITDTFDMKGNVTYTKTLTLPLIQKIDQDRYKLRVRISDRDSPGIEVTYELDIGTKRHEVEVRDVVLSPDKEIKAGRALLATVRVRNRGEKEEDGVKVVVSIPKLGVSAADFIDELEKEGEDDDQETTEEMFLRIPEDAETGDYEVVVDVYYDDGDKKNSYKTSIFVLGEDEDEDDRDEMDEDEKDEEDDEPKPGKSDDRTIITVAVDKQSAARGSEVGYPIALTNDGKTSKAYMIKTDGPASLNLRASPNVLLIKKGESETFTVYASAKSDAAAGQQMFTVTISSNDKVLKQLPLSLNVEGGQESGSGMSTVKRGIEVGLVVLVVLIVIVGLVIGFSKLRGDDEEEGKEGKEYY